MHDDLGYRIRVSGVSIEMLLFQHCFVSMDDDLGYRIRGSGVSIEMDRILQLDGVTCLSDLLSFLFFQRRDRSFLCFRPWWHQLPSAACTVRW